MYWLQLTQARTGAKIYVNMELVMIIAPNKAGGSSLVLSVAEAAAEGKKMTSRIVQVLEEQEEIMEMFNRPE
jgi:transcription termination factor Rho